MNIDTLSIVYDFLADIEKIRMSMTCKYFRNEILKNLSKIKNDYESEYETISSCIVDLDSVNFEDVDMETLAEPTYHKFICDNYIAFRCLPKRAKFAKDILIRSKFAMYKIEKAIEKHDLIKFNWIVNNTYIVSYTTGDYELKVMNKESFEGEIFLQAFNNNLIPLAKMYNKCLSNKEMTCTNDLLKFSLKNLCLVNIQRLLDVGLPKETLEMHLKELDDYMFESVPIDINKIAAYIKRGHACGYFSSAFIGYVVAKNCYEREEVKCIIAINDICLINDTFVEACKLERRKFVIELHNNYKIDNEIAQQAFNFSYKTNTSSFTVNWLYNTFNISVHHNMLQENVCNNVKNWLKTVVYR